MLIDSHCHLQFQAYNEDRDDVIKRCQDRGVTLNLVGTQKDTSKAAVELAQNYAGMYATIGLHPIHLFKTTVDEEESHFASRGENFAEIYYNELAQSPKVIAFGETGLDLHHIPDNVPVEEVLQEQRRVFLQHYHCAEQNNLPLVIHVREAHEEMIRVLREQATHFRGVVHCYTGNWEFAQTYLSMGLYLGFTGVITFPPKKTNSKPQEELLKVLAKCPLDRILIETDAPYLAPQVYRGERCEPWMVEEVAKKIAEVKGLKFNEVQSVTVENTKRLFTRIL